MRLTPRTFGSLPKATTTMSVESSYSEKLYRNDNAREPTKTMLLVVEGSLQGLDSSFRTSR